MTCCMRRRRDRRPVERRALCMLLLLLQLLSAMASSSSSSQPPTHNASAAASPSASHGYTPSASASNAGTLCLIWRPCCMKRCMKSCCICCIKRHTSHSHCDAVWLPYSSHTACMLIQPYSSYTIHHHTPSLRFSSLAALAGVPESTMEYQRVPHATKYGN